jgi:hypothetical protein
MVISALNNVMAVIKCCAFTTCTATTACSYQTIAVNKRNYMVISAFNDIDNLAHRDLFSSHIAVSSCCHMYHGAFPALQSSATKASLLPNRWSEALALP